MDTLMTLSIRFQYRRTSHLLIPDRRMIRDDEECAQFDRLMRRMPPLRLDELAQYIDTASFVRWERAVVGLSLADCKMAALYEYLQIYLHKATPKEMRILAEGLEVRATPKDLQDRRRFMQRMVGEVCKPRHRQRALYHVGHAFLFPVLRKALRDDVSIEEIEQIVTDHYMDKSTLDPQNDSDVRAFRRATRHTFLNLILLHEDDELVAAWLNKFRQGVDPHQKTFERLLRRNWDELLYAARLAVSRKDQSVDLASAQRAAQLEQELAALRAQYDADVQGLLAVIEELRQVQQTAREQTAATCVSAVPAPGLCGRRILVVGDESHAAQYRQLVEAHGGEFSFVPGFDKDRSLHSRLQAADAVVFVTAYASHLKFYATKARLEDRPMALVNQAGLTAFGRGLDELRERLTQSERRVV